jgi:hypothetical protein
MVQSSWTYRRFFQVIEEVLARDDFAALREAVSRQLELPYPTDCLEEIRIFAEKHGNWYHPAKIEALTSEGQARFVLNTALTERGRAVMSGEIRALNCLRNRYSYSWLPTVYFHAEYETPSFFSEEGGPPLSFFLADWFEGFHEFHLSIEPVKKIQRLLLWDGSPSPNYLSERQGREVYCQISRILTRYFNPRTFEQIFPWHHGAGDFVVRVKGDGVEVRLVTARQYRAMADPGEMSLEEALLFFFVNLSLRMRLDRLNGVGEIVWAEDDCLDPIWEGFHEALRIKEKEGSLASSFRDPFFKGLRRLSLEEVTEKFSNLLDSYDPHAPDLPVINKNMVSHILLVFKTITGPMSY